MAVDNSGYFPGRSSPVDEVVGHDANNMRRLYVHENDRVLVKVLQFFSQCNNLCMATAWICASSLHMIENIHAQHKIIISIHFLGWQVNIWSFSWFVSSFYQLRSFVGQHDSLDFVKSNFTEKRPHCITPSFFVCLSLALYRRVQKAWMRAQCMF
jgi:hypothetical protein